jgi:hypothetical protein
MPLNSVTALRHQAQTSRAQMKLLPRVNTKAIPASHRLLSAFVAISVPIVGVLAAIGVSRLT